MIGYDVLRVLPDGTRVALGVLACTDADAHGRFRSEFAYDAAYLAAREATAIDPFRLPLQPGAWQAEQFDPPLGVFEDALPDAWGRRLMRRIAGAGRAGEAQMLGMLGEDGIGALRFVARGGRVDRLPTPAATVPLVDLLAAAREFERGGPIDDPSMQQLLAAGRTPGGARPKALVQANGLPWLAKFPSALLDEGLDIIALEAATLMTAAQARIVVPPHRLQRVGGRRVLRGQRFDVLGADLRGRAHLASLKTLCGERRGAQASGYGELAAAVRRASAAPRADVAALFRLAVFNAAVGNTDDHTKNVWMGDAGAGWRLAPAFDLLPDTGARGEHALSFGLHNTPPDADGWRDIGRAWAVRDAAEIVADVLAAVQRWPAHARVCGVPQPQIERFAADIARRAALMRRRAASGRKR